MTSAGQTPGPLNDGLESEEDIEDARNRALSAVIRSQGDWAAASLNDGGEDYPISDLICNLLHLGDRYGFDHNSLIESALRHYDAGRYVDEA